MEIRNDVVEYDDGYNRLCLNDNSFALRECSMCGAASFISPTGHLGAISEGSTTTKVRVEEFTIKKGWRECVQLSGRWRKFTDTYSVAK